MNQLLGNLTFHPEHGALSLQSARYVMMSPTLVVELQKKIEAHLPQEVVEIMTQTAFGDGASLASRYRDAFNYSTEQVAHAVSYMLTQSGWGECRRRWSTSRTKRSCSRLLARLSRKSTARPRSPSATPCLDFFRALP